MRTLVSKRNARLFVDLGPCESDDVRDSKRMPRFIAILYHDGLTLKSNKTSDTLVTISDGLIDHHDFKEGVMFVEV